MDVFDLLDNVSKGAFTVFKDLRTNRNITYNTVIHHHDIRLSKTDKEVYSRRITELVKVGLIKKVKKGIQFSDDSELYVEPRRTYIINPWVVSCLNTTESIYLWRQC
jgi:hypothetical protein